MEALFERGSVRLQNYTTILIVHTPAFPFTLLFSPDKLSLQLTKDQPYVDAISEKKRKEKEKEKEKEKKRKEKNIQRWRTRISLAEEERFYLPFGESNTKGFLSC